MALLRHKLALPATPTCDTNNTPCQPSKQGSTATRRPHTKGSSLHDQGTTPPLRVVLADFGLSHLLSKAATLSTWVAVGTDGSAGSTPAAAHSVLSPSQASTFLTGDEALFPVEWNAPEVCVPTAKGTVASYATDVYMVGGFLYELLTGGTRPFAGVVKLAERRASRDPVQLEPGLMAPGLYGVSVLELAAANGTRLPLCVRGVEGEAGAARLQACLDVLRDCVAMEPGARPSAATLESRLRALHDALVAEARAAGSDDGRGPATPLGGSRSPSPEAGYVAASECVLFPHGMRCGFALRILCVRFVGQGGAATSGANRPSWPSCIAGIPRRWVGL